MKVTLQTSKGDIVLVRPGASVPADGLVREGASDVNEAMITGESRPVPKRADAAVIAGTVNGSGSLRVEVTGTGDKTALAGIMRLVAQAQTSRSRAQALADRAALALTIIAVVAAGLTLVGWFLAGDPLMDNSYVAILTPILVMTIAHLISRDPADKAVDVFGHPAELEKTAPRTT